MRQWIDGSGAMRQKQNGNLFFAPVLYWQTTARKNAKYFFDIFSVMYHKVTCQAGTHTNIVILFLPIIMQNILSQS